MWIDTAEQSKVLLMVMSLLINYTVKMTDLCRYRAEKKASSPNRALAFNLSVFVDFYY